MAVLRLGLVELHGEFPLNVRKRRHQEPELECPVLLEQSLAGSSPVQQQRLGFSLFLPRPGPPDDRLGVLQPEQGEALQHVQLLDPPISRRRAALRAALSMPDLD